MSALVAAIFLASLLGSLHCAGMCGAFVAFAVGGDPANTNQCRRLHAAYNGGRLLTYVLLGVVAGALGATLDLGGAKLLGIQRAAGVLAGVTMILFGSLTLLRIAGVSVALPGSPRFMHNTVMTGHRAAARLGPTPRAFTIGLLTTLLPCGWLWAFVVTAAGTANPLRGAVVMAVFWTGTLPLMLTLGLGVQKLTGALAAKLPAVTATALVLVGLYTLIARMQMGPISLGQATELRTPAALLANVHAAENETPACCRKKEQ